MKFDLKNPCKNCPFRSDETRIKFSCRERAEEIEEQAYRNGFPCHLSAEYVEEDEDRPWKQHGYTAGQNSQHCVGYIIMQLKECYDSPWPGINNDEELMYKLAEQVNMNAPVFDSSEEFFEANEAA